MARIRRKGKNSWQVIIDVGRGPDGERLRRFITVKGTKRDAERECRKIASDWDQGIDRGPGQLTVADFLKRWLTDYAQVKVSPSTLHRYRLIVEHHLIPALGHLKLRELRPLQIQHAYSNFTRRDGRPGTLSSKTVREHAALLREALGHAVKWQLLASNPALAVDPPSVDRREMRCLTSEEVGRLLAAAEGTPYRTIIYVAVQTGLRLGEVVALQWRNVDLDGGSLEGPTLRVVRTARFYKGKGIVYGQPKSHRSSRSVALSPATVHALREHRRQQLERRLAAGSAYEDGDLVCADALGKPVYDSTVRRAFYAITERAGLEHLRLHDLRHTAATLLLGQGIHPKIVSERLGHSTISVTLDTYSHVTPTMQREAAATMDAVLGATSS